MQFRAIDAWLLATVTLYSTDHWIGATVCLATCLLSFAMQPKAFA